MVNAEWEPDPSEIDYVNHYSCQHNRGSIFSSTIGIPSLTPVVPSETANLITVFASITISVCSVNSIVFLFIGYGCGWFGHKRKQSHTISDLAKKNVRIEQSHDQLPQTAGPLYEEL